MPKTKNEETKLTAITPAGLPELSLARECEDYKSLMERRRDLQSQVRKDRNFLDAILKEHELYGETRGRKYWEVTDRIQVYEKRVPSTDKDVLKAVDKWGYNINHVAGKAKLMKFLEKRLDRKALDFLEAVSEEYDATQFTAPVLDKKETEKVQAAFKERADSLMETDNELEKVDNAIADLDKYLNFLEKMSNLKRNSKDD